MMNQSTERLLATASPTSDCYGHTNGGNDYDSNASSMSSRCVSPESSVFYSDTPGPPSFALGGAYRTRHLSCILENWSESESYNSLPPEFTKKTDDSFDGLLDLQQPMAWEAEDVSEYITTLDESCILDIESIERVDQFGCMPSATAAIPASSSVQKSSKSTNQSKDSLFFGSSDMTNSGEPNDKFPNIMTTSCYGSLNSASTVTMMADVDVHQSTEELLPLKNMAYEFLYLNAMPSASNQPKSRSPLPASLSSSFCEGTTSMNNSFYESKSMQTSMDVMGGSNGGGCSKAKINPLELSMVSQDGTNALVDEIIPSMKEKVDNGEYLYSVLLTLIQISIQIGIDHFFYKLIISNKIEISAQSIHFDKFTNIFSNC